MNFLTWVFGLGALAIAFPLLFHLIRRTPRGKQTFSSLMFLRESPPKITRKSRLENWFLLLLRALAVALLAIAFMRPFFPQATQVTGSLGKRVAILVDTSASMRRADLWQNAVNKVNEIMGELDSNDDIALFAFDREVTTAIPFDSNSITGLENKKTLVQQELKRLSPSWSQTDLGKALIFAADQLDETEEQEDADQEIQVGGQIHVVTDSQEGAETTALASYNWPGNVMVQVHSLKLQTPGNVYPKIMVDETGKNDDRIPRVRLTNSSDSAQDEFVVRWDDGSNTTNSTSVKFFVPPGQSQVLPVPQPDSTSQFDRLIISGDSSTFDDQFFVTPLTQQKIVVGYVGDDSADDVEGLQYYLTRAYSETPARKIDVIDREEELRTLVGNSAKTPDLMVVSKAVDASMLDSLTQHLKLGKTVLVMLGSVEMAESLKPLLGDLQVESVSGQSDSDYRMLGQIDFKHPLFKPLSSPQFNDFTKIRFWSHRAVLNLNESAHVLARFDNGDPAIWFSNLGNESNSQEGTLLVMTSGWNPDDSQLGLSTKFVPLMLEVLEQAIAAQTLKKTSWLVDDTIELPEPKTEMARKIVVPGGNEIKLSRDDKVFGGAIEPGVYQLQQDGQQVSFVVNLNENESRTTPVDAEQLAIYQVRLGNQPTDLEVVERLQRANNIQIESRQKIWKWAIVAILIVLIGETILAGRRQNLQQVQPEVAG